MGACNTAWDEKMQIYGLTKTIKELRAEEMMLKEKINDNVDNLQLLDILFSQLHKVINTIKYLEKAKDALVNESESDSD